MASTPVTGNGTLVSGLGGPAGYGELTIARNDDGSQLISNIASVFENGLDFFGTTYTSFYVNTNGSISFGSGISTYTPTTIIGGFTPMIAPFWADIDTRTPSSIGATSAPIYVDMNPLKDIITITWGGVNYFDYNGDKQNFFQLQLYDRGGNGDFDIVFRYQAINWTTGDVSGGSGGLGGTPARAGYTSGSGTFFELPQSGNQSSLLALETTSGNTGTTGLWHFPVRNGEIEELLTSTNVIFNQQGKLVFLAALAHAAYNLRSDTDLSDGVNTNEVIGNDINNATSPAQREAFLLGDQYLKLLGPDDMPSLAPVATGNGSFPSEGLETGIYTNANAAALVARSADALFVSFRGTNDFDGLFDLFATPDSGHWSTSGKAAHYQLFADLNAAIDVYLGAHPEITKVYVTGHSLGGAMAHAFMQGHSGDARFEAVTFGSLGAGAGTDLADPRITNFMNSDDIAQLYDDRSDGDDNTFENGVGGDIESHGMDLYLAEARFLRANGYDLNDLNASPDYDAIFFETYGNVGSYTFGTGNETLTGTMGADLLLGGAGTDTILGALGNDKLVGGAGKDITTGGGGLDSMVLRTLGDSGITFAARDVINTYAHGDKIDLSAIDANASAAGNQAFVFVSSFNGVAGQLQWDLTNISPTGVKGYLVQGDVNGDAAADFSLQIYTSPTNNLPGGSAGWNLAAWDFIL